MRTDNRSNTNNLPERETVRLHSHFWGGLVFGLRATSANEHQKAAIELNVRLRQGQSDDPLWREKAELIHQSIERTRTMESYVNDPSWIPVCCTYFPGCIATGSTKKSYAKFWVAVGALEHAGDSFNELVLTPKQLETAHFDWEEVTLKGLKGKNFSKVRVLQ
jgi:hypothetical protein